MPSSGDRVHLTLVIESVDELYSSLAPRLCPDGVFIETGRPAPEGSDVGFRVMLDDGVVLIQGQGTVIWTRTPGSSDGPAGMAVHFDSIDGDTRDTVDAVIDAHLSTGGELFDLDGGSPGDVYPTDALDQSSGVAEGGAAWLFDDELDDLAGAPAAPPQAADADGEQEVVDLRFEEAISGFTETDVAAGGDEAKSVDRAISAAVVAPATTPKPEPETAAVETGQATGGDGEAEEIPEILDQWRQELQVAGAPAGRTVESGREGPDRTEWETLLPFDAEGALDDGPSPNATRPVEPISSARRTPPSPRRRRWWWPVVPVAVIVIAGLVLVLGRGGERSMEEQEPVAAETAEASPAREQARGESDKPPRMTETAGAPAAPTAAEASAAMRARTVRTVQWRTEAGASQVMIRGDGVFGAGQVDAIRLGDPPRVLVRVRGIATPYRPNRLDVDSPELVAVRVGYHPELDPPTLYVVLDLTTSEIDSAGALQVDGDVARVTVRSGGS